jgi:hypothetical protein
VRAGAPNAPGTKPGLPTPRIEYRSRGTLAHVPDTFLVKAVGRCYLIVMIPVIDLGPYLSARPHASAATAAELGRALQDVGFFFGTVLRLPPEQLARLHILPQSQLDAWLAAGHFHTVTIGTTDPRVQVLGLLRRAP